MGLYLTPLGKIRYEDLLYRDCTRLPLKDYLIMVIEHYSGLGKNYPWHQFSQVWPTSIPSLDMVRDLYRMVIDELIEEGLIEDK